GAAGSLVRELVPERAGNDGMHEFADVAAEARDLANQRRRDEVELLGRRQEDRLDLVREVAAHRRELELELEIGDRAQAAYDHVETVLAREIDRETGVTRDLDVRHVGEHRARELDTLLEREQRRLVRVGRDRDDDLVEDAAGTP